MTLKEFELIKDKFGFAKDQFDFTKQQTQLKTLADAGDFDGFGEMFNDIYGSGIDVSHLQSDQAMGEFLDGASIIGDLVASGASWEDALPMLEKSGALEKMGMTEGDVESFYNNAKLQSDPLFQAQSLADSWVDQGIMDEDEAGWIGRLYAVTWMDGNARL